ncbi:protein of unknown function [Actinopolymorpha cephalotaxi]|uniref:DUF1707 domain-containing protein n=1 Tax=Actinopolymorpha cephalotaxi TaxID=504797 RepID=A0A1I2YUJ2_9ACTN|nr:DUF1707 domain-containing protein [Actinopolymorpha cephalotaxi]NYH81703.1 hypothetical protein [Actinopolymorpha cephalotaxi]SFH29318.1 protein of unknown function [Actinopolymorpha cephalotaxi]
MSNTPWASGGSGELRASDADREQTAEVLRRAAGAGRLDFEELDNRLERTYAARTYAELVPLTADLPEAAERPSRQQGGTAANAPARPGPAEVNALLSSQKVNGRWLVPPRLSARAYLGDVTLDFTEAAIPHEVVLDVQVGMGQLTLIVPDDIAVDFERGTTVLAERKNKTRGVQGPGTPVIRVRGTVVLGELTAKPPRRGWFRR